MESDSNILKLNIRYMLREPVLRFELFALAVLCILLAYVWLFVVNPLTSEYDNKSSEMIELQGKIEEKISLNSLAAEYNKTESVIALIEEKLSSSFSQAELTRKFNSLAHENGVEIVTMNTKNGALSSGYRSYINEVTFTANYSSVKGLIDSLSELPGLNNITEISMSRDDESGKVAGTMILMTAKAAN